MWSWGYVPKLAQFFSAYFYLIHLMLNTSVHRHYICYTDSNDRSEHGSVSFVLCVQAVSHVSLFHSQMEPLCRPIQRPQPPKHTHQWNGYIGFPAWDMLKGSFPASHGWKECPSVFSPLLHLASVFFSPGKHLRWGPGGDYRKEAITTQCGERGHGMQLPVAWEEEVQDPRQDGSNTTLWSSWERP